MIFPQRRPYDTYPGTSRPLDTPTPYLPQAGRAHWDEDPIYKRQGGHFREFFGIGHLSAAIQRSPKTIYKWERASLFPSATFIYNGGSKHGQRRLYTRIQIEGVIRIAQEEGILNGNRRYIASTLFPARCAELFRTTRNVLPEPIQDWNLHV
ncbi:hypothetical protein [Saccharothrix sp. ST-888]|uniref:hypothetical protein n=1 Tax=Saccharothrix sp. ST-888 TaxID=1427391 RepID=UPI0005ECAD37|nr:hypothetical protein [Saccharothrix sp. ST-888]KJK56218.1 hypothetical protein UK12_23825 [Saccharothrix sp. ST-888]